MTMMTYYKKCCLLPALLCALAALSHGAPRESEPLPAVPAAIAKGDLLQGKVNPKAKVYFLFSASSKNEVCREYGVGIAKAYREMKGKGAELILLTKESPATVLAWTKKIGLRCPVLPESRRSPKLSFPYAGDHTPPLLLAVDPEGRKLGEDNHLRVLVLLSSWRELVEEVENAEKQRDDDNDDNWEDDEEIDD